MTGIEGLVASATHLPQLLLTVLRDLRRHATATVPRVPRHAVLHRPIPTCLLPAELHALEADRHHTVADHAALADHTSGRKVTHGGLVQGRRLVETTRRPGRGTTRLHPGETTLLRVAITLRRHAVNTLPDVNTHPDGMTSGGISVCGRRCAIMRTLVTIGAHLAWTVR